MNKNKVTWITAGVAALWLILIVAWHLYTPADKFALQVPGADNRPAGTARKADDVVIGEFYMNYDENQDLSMDTGHDTWGSFRGNNRDNIVKTDAQINVTSDYPEVWSLTTGEGHAAPVVYNGKVYILDYDETLSSDLLRCISLQTGKELWRRWYRVRMKRNHGFSRTIPAVGEGYVVTLGPEGHVMCCDPDTGDMKWSHDLKQEYGSEIPFWYAGQCPLVDEGTVVLAPAGTDTLMIGLKVESGEVEWATPNTLHLKMSHSSVMPMTLDGKKTYVYVGVGGVCGVSAEAADRGTLLWSATKWQPSVVAPSPLQIGPNRVFLVAGYGTGGALLQVNRQGSAWNAQILDQYKADKGLSAEQQTPILYNGNIISIVPKDGGGNRERLVMYNPSDLHSVVWRSESDEKFGLGPFLVINDLCFAFHELGDLYVYQIGRNEMKLLKKQHIMDGVDAWGPIAYADGMLILRDAHNVKCIRII